MSKTINKKDFKLKSKEKWVNTNTGEKRDLLTAEVDISQTKTDRPSFLICVLSQILKLTDIVGNKKMQVVNYILSNMSKKGEYANTLIKTQREIAKESEVSIQTVSITLKELEKANIISKKTGAIMLHPDLAMMGSGDKRNSLLVNFKGFSNDETSNNCTQKNNDKLDTKPVKGQTSINDYDFINTAKASEIASVTMNTIRNYCKKDKVKYKKENKQYFIQKESLLNFLNK